MDTPLASQWPCEVTSTPTASAGTLPVRHGVACTWLESNIANGAYVGGIRPGFTSALGSSPK
jgi:hypothetical protein